MQLSNLLCFVSLGIDINSEIQFWDLLAASCIISFLASLPMTINGWGIREIASIYFFGLLGMSSENAIAISISVGVLSTLAVLSYSLVSIKLKKIKISTLEAKINNNLQRPFTEFSNWLLTSLICVLIFFQLKLSLFQNFININLADPLIFICLALICISFTKIINSYNGNIHL